MAAAVPFSYLTHLLVSYRSKICCHSPFGFVGARPHVLQVNTALVSFVLLVRVPSSLLRRPASGQNRAFRGMRPQFGPFSMQNLVVLVRGVYLCLHTIGVRNFPDGDAVGNTRRGISLWSSIQVGRQS